MSRQINSGDPGAGFPSQRDFHQKGVIADADLTIVGYKDPTKQLVFDVAAETAGKTITVAAGANTGNVTLTLPASTGTLALTTDVPTPAPVGVRAYISDHKTSGTDGGDATMGSWLQRDLNTIVDKSSGITVSSNDMVIPAGTWQVKASCPFVATATTLLRLYNSTDSSVVLTGSSSWASNGLVADLVGEFTLSATKHIQLQYYCNANQPTNGLGVALNLAAQDEIYSFVYIEKIV